MSRAPVLLASLALALCTLAPAQATGQSAPADRPARSLLPGCEMDRMTRCWYLFFGTGDAPTRQAFLLDLKTRVPAGESHLVEVDVIHAHETDDPAVPGANDFLLMTLQFDCARKQSRIAGGYALMFDARVDHAPGASPWTGGYEKNWQGLVARVACDPDARRDPKDMVWLGGFYRPVDVVDIVRRYLWKQAP